MKAETAGPQRGVLSSGMATGMPDTWECAEPTRSDLPRSAQATLLAVDIIGFGNTSRDDETRKDMRAALYTNLLPKAFADSGLNMDDRYYWSDCGDGALYVMPSVSTACYIDPFIGSMQAGLRSYNRNLREIAQIKLRVALHVGTVHFDEHGVFGQTRDRLFGFLDAPTFKAGVARLGTDLAFITSDYVYDDVIRHLPGMVDPDHFHWTDVSLEGETQRAWMYFPPGLTPPEIDLPRPRSAEPLAGERPQFPTLAK